MVILLTALTATIGNGVFIAVLIQCRSMQSDAHMILLLTIAICDLGISIVGYPFTIISNYMGAWIFGDLICKMYAFCCYTLSMVIVNKFDSWTLCNLSYLLLDSGQYSSGRVYIPLHHCVQTRKQ